MLQNFIKIASWSIDFFFWPRALWMFFLHETLHVGETFNNVCKKKKQGHERTFNQPNHFINYVLCVPGDFNFVPTALSIAEIKE